MSWSIRISSDAEKYYQRLDREQRKSIKKRLIKLSQQENPLENPQVKALTRELKGFYRLRVGNYRLIFSLLRKVTDVNYFFSRNNCR